MPDTNIISQTFVLHADNDQSEKHTTTVIKTKSRGIYRNFRYTESGIEPLEFDLSAMEWNDELRIPAQIIPTPPAIEKKIVTFANFGNELSVSDDERLFTLQFKSGFPIYIIDRFAFYGLNSDLYLTDNNIKPFDTFVERRAVYAGQIDYEQMEQVRKMWAPKVSLKDYHSMGYDNRITI